MDVDFGGGEILNDSIVEGISDGMGDKDDKKSVSWTTREGKKKVVECQR